MNSQRKHFPILQSTIAALKMTISLIRVRWSGSVSVVNLTTARSILKAICIYHSAFKWNLHPSWTNDECNVFDAASLGTLWNSSESIFSQTSLKLGGEFLSADIRKLPFLSIWANIQTDCFSLCIRSSNAALRHQTAGQSSGVKCWQCVIREAFSISAWVWRTHPPLITPPHPPSCLCSPLLAYPLPNPWWWYYVVFVRKWDTAPTQHMCVSLCMNCLL